MGRSYLSVRLALVFGVVVASLAAGVERVRDVRVSLQAGPAVEAEPEADPCDEAGATLLRPVALVVTGEVLGALELWWAPEDTTSSPDRACPAERVS